MYYFQNGVDTMHVDIKECEYNSFGWRSKQTGLDAAGRVAIYEYVEPFCFTLGRRSRSWCRKVQLRIRRVPLQELSYAEYLAKVRRTDSKILQLRLDGLPLR